MSLIPLDTLLARVTPDSVKSSLYGIASSLGLSTTSWGSGSVVRTLIAVVAQLYSGLVDLMVLVTRYGFLDLSEGDWLRRLALEVYGVAAIEATYATGGVTLTNAGGGVYSFDPGDVVVRCSATGKTYLNVDAFALGASSASTQQFRAAELGTASNAAPAGIDELVTTLVGVTVTNAAAVVGVDGETDASLRERCRDSLGALSPDGPRAAYQFVARTPGLVGGVIVARVRTLAADGYGSVTVVIAGPEGGLDAGSVTSVQTGVDAWATPLGVAATVQSATEVPLTVDATVYVTTAGGLTSGAVEAMAKTALQSYVNGLPIGGIDLGAGGKVLWRALVGQLEAMSAYVLHAELTSETDTSLSTTQIATLVDGDITITVEQVAP